jgi:tetratricopeptide (TPR) repeat protein
VPARRLREALAALRQQLDGIQSPLNELRIVSDGRRIVVEHEGARLEPLSGQLLLNFDTRALGENVSVMPERTAEEWFAMALNCEGDPGRRREAIEAYRQVLKKRPDWVEAQINLGTLLYEEDEPQEAVKAYRRAVELEPGTRWRASIWVACWTNSVRSAWPAKSCARRCDLNPTTPTRTTTWRWWRKNSAAGPKPAVTGSATCNSIPPARGQRLRAGG